MGSVGKESGLVVILMAMAMALLGSMLCEGKADSKGFEEPLNCKKLECPPYQVIETQKDFEIRSYTSARWVSSTQRNSTSFKDGSSKGFKILFYYFLGKNKQAATIDMTAPVFVDINPSNASGLSSNSSYIVYFYLPQKYQKSPPPPPLSDQVRPVTLPKYKYAAVRRFGGFLKNINITSQVTALKKSLKGTPSESAIAKTYGTGAVVPYTVAGYNSPFEYVNRVNEVMFWFDQRKRGGVGLMTRDHLGQVKWITAIPISNTQSAKAVEALRWEVTLAKEKGSEHFSFEGDAQCSECGNHWKNTHCVPSRVTNNPGSNNCKLLDWMGTGEVVAAGHWSSSDPNERVHHIPLGPNAMRVWVDVVKKREVFLRRPTSDILYIEEAKGTTVAWPADKVLMDSSSMPG
ncbi:hypothetical protein Vadar_016355 [Vaccinium darrowii]|uniref:Uncharacterized protein n=1 Tax=Vaccinium darrowii TaxID=229202 RepID=A0ACB7Y7S3_9ERIC|nr:hypothetical protein Vadar_016355 [Vaccinium darrowii]